MAKKVYNMENMLVSFFFGSALWGFFGTLVMMVWFYDVLELESDMELVEWADLVIWSISAVGASGTTFVFGAISAVFGPLVVNIKNLRIKTNTTSLPEHEDTMNSESKQSPSSPPNSPPYTVTDDRNNDPPL